METNNFIEFKKERDLGAIISDTFKFIRENWKEYFSFIVRIIGPILLIGAAFLMFAVISYSGAAKGLLTLDQGDPSLFLKGFSGIFGWAFVMMIVWALVYTLLAEVSLYYVKSYINNNGVANFEEVKQNTYKNIWKFIGLGILSILLTLVGYVLCFLPSIYIIIVLFLGFPIMVFENKSVGDTISHCFKLIKGEWWNTFGVVIVLSLLVGILGIAFTIPQMIYQLISTGLFMNIEDPTAIIGLFDDPIYMALTFIAYFGKFLFYSITLIASAFIYFDLNEQKNFTGTFEKIDSLGETN
ncbi:glycerophosphoryl diester phosphodiesterase membrane domain-containing protein [Lutibacter flavus]|uniref:Glycerophosphoryl diester phosphodiesterase membrane domain-containing protein n=1 Tax=Lutibacter flavus TaxID=691689 RepID=A0A238VAG1_9FLAO|nr:glycerophosphoryl diester phosphodiesterase membrane domain-containing protein [Lutibacter flavus]SNR31385.1 hypothetical protein SAMN04488111_0191 [Lutibacter flavus]